MKKFILAGWLLCLLSANASAQMGIHHLVLFKLKAGVDKSDPRYKNAVSLLQKLPEEIPAILNMRAGENFSDRPIAADYGLMVLLANEKSLLEYAEHPAHKAVAAAWKEISDWTIADFWSPVEKEEP